MSSKNQDFIKPGKYQHFKGAYYQVIGTARHSETSDILVVYRPLYGEGGLWVRPLDMFNEIVTRGDKQCPRFSLVESD